MPTENTDAAVPNDCVAPQLDRSPPQHASGVQIAAEIADCVNYASWQNSVPILRSLDVRNTTPDTLNELRLEFDTSPAFTRPKHWLIPRLLPGETCALRDRDLQLDPDYLNTLNEAERSHATFRLFQQDRVVAETTHDIRVLARDEWGGMSAMGALLAAFVTPNDPALAKLLKSAASVLANHGHSSALDGYQSQDPRRAFLLTAAIWSAMAAESLTYANPPSSFEERGQKIRRPATVLHDGLATCLDTTLLFASAIEAIGLNPVIIMLQGHCFAGVWLVEKVARQSMETDCGEIRKALAAKELLTFETTLITHQPAARFEDAVRTAANATNETNEGKFVAAIDISRARMSQIRPLASHHSPAVAEPQQHTSHAPLPLPAAPQWGAVAAEQAAEKPTTPSGRIDRWQRKLLDLSLRNRLLNFKLNAQSVPVICQEVSLLEDRLAEGKKLRVTSLLDQNPMGQRDGELHRQKTFQDLQVEFARQALDRNELSCPLTGPELTKRLTTLYREVSNDLAEGGSNTLYLAVGFLKWKPKPDDAKSFRAPLLLVPVKLIRTSALSPFQLVQHEDEVHFNATLIQLLKKDFGCDLSFLESELPTDNSGVNVPLVLEHVRREVREIPGFEVVDESVLARFSFAKYLMWKDLVDRLDQLEQNRLVRHLIRTPDQPFRPGPTKGIPHPREIDSRFEPQELFHPLPADSSQLAAIMAASEKQDFVLVGPPGTGKSQTIANIIAQCLANQKTVLFVAEKTAALDVVYRRLREHGLGDCCLELHSNRAERRKFLQQLQISWQNNQRSDGADWVRVNDRLKVRRDELNDYVKAVHARHANGWSVHQALGICVSGDALPTPNLEWPETVEHDTVAYQQLTQLVDELALTHAAIDRAAMLPNIAACEWSAAWQTKLLSQCEQLKSVATSVLTAWTDLASSLGLSPRQDCSFAELTNLHRLATALLACQGADLRIIFHKDFAKLPTALTRLQKSISTYHSARQRAAATYDDASLERIPVNDIEHQWRQASAAMWPISWFAKRKVTRLLQSYASQGLVDPKTDLAAIRVMQEQRAAIAQSPFAGQTDYWQGLETDAAGLQAILKQAGELRQAIIDIGQSTQKTNELSKTVHGLLKRAPNETPVFRLATALLSELQAFLKTVKDFEETAGTSPLNQQTSTVVADCVTTATQIQTHRTQLQRWTAWCAVQQRAASFGLTPFITELNAGRLLHSDLAKRFQLAYARWWLPARIDRSPVLRAFQRFKHEDAIADFCRLDDLARSLAPSVVKAAIAHGLPAPDQVPRQSELGLLRHQMNLKRPSKSIREMVSGMPDAFGKLAPCLLMSPLSIAQYLPATQALFDVVIFDEASQITTWDAIGAIARGRQTIIVGDPKQLPPTNFFGRSEDDTENEELEEHEKDLESILDEAQAGGLPTLQLNWHYRSRHESLIAFSNRNYYGNQLVTFPAAESVDRGVSFRHLPTSNYDRGKSRTNRYEADAIVRDTVVRMKRCLEKPEPDRLTYGVITFNSQQQTLIQDLFDQAIRDQPELEWFFSEERIEPTVVKNLENVQGDERDVMAFSITFGPDAAGKLPLTFGALNRDGGERRLNVAVTRARRELIVYSSFKGDQLHAERSGKRGVRDLKAFLDYAEKGPIALHARTEGSVGGFDSPFEEGVCAALAERGWQVVTQVGVSGFRVDLGIVHPDKPGAFLAGIECDGATYHRSAIARDRDKTRQQILENLGWHIIRVWSPDWWYDPDSATRRVHEALNERLREDRQLVEKSKVEVTAEPDSVTHNPDAAEAAPSLETVPADEADPEFVDGNTEEVAAARVVVAGQVAAIMAPPAAAVATTELLVDAKVYFSRAQLPDASEHQQLFFDSTYAERLRWMAITIVQHEFPIREDVLVKQIARLHGFSRTGTNIRQRVVELLGEVHATDESTGRFLWSAEGPRAVVPFRHARENEAVRNLDEIALAELIGLIHEYRPLLTQEDPAVAFARLIGLTRLSKSARERLEEAIAQVS